MHDFLSLYFIALIIIAAVPVFIYSFGYLKEYRKNYSIKYFWGMMISFILSMIGVVLSDNSISFIVFWELMSATSFFLVIYEYKKSENIKSGIMYFIMTHISGLLVMIMFILIAKFTGTYDFITIAGNAKQLPDFQKWIILIFALLGFGSKAGLVPMHAWLPKAHPAAPSNVSALMSGIMLKIAVYGFIRTAFIFMGNISVYYGILIMVIGTATAIFSVINALFQNDIKKLLAYSSAENIGLIFSTLGLSLILRSFSLDGLSALTLTAALFHILNHAVFKSLLFMSAGSVLFATSTKNMNELGGLYKKMRFAGICAFVGTAAIAAIPPLNGFAGEILIFSNFIQSVSNLNSPAISIVIIFCGITLALTSGGVIWASVKSFGITFLGEPRSLKAVNVKKIPASMNIGMAILAAYTVILGVFSPFVINFIYKWISKTNYVNIAGYEITVISAILILVVLIIYSFTKVFSKEEKVHSNETWGCGFSNKKPYIQYSPDGFVQPGIKLMGNIVSYRKEVNVKETIYIRGRIRDIIESNIYLRLIKAVDYIASKIIKIHYGKIQIYVSYIFIALIISIIFVIKFV
jgi:hydrogenase-4 component B